MKIIRPDNTWRILACGSGDGMCLQRLALKHGYRVAGICQEIGCSDRHLRDVFLRDIGLPPKEWMRHERLVVARRKLAGGRSPSQVSQDLGFASPSNFSRDFQRLYGVSPLRFQRDRRQESMAPCFECL